MCQITRFTAEYESTLGEKLTIARMVGMYSFEIILNRSLLSTLSAYQDSRSYALDR